MRCRRSAFQWTLCVLGFCFSLAWEQPRGQVPTNVVFSHRRVCTAAKLTRREQNQELHKAAFARLARPWFFDPCPSMFLEFSFL